MAVVVKKKLAQGATKQELTTHQITDTKAELKKQPFVIRSVALTAENEETLEHLKQDATDAIGRPISSSALLRAFVRFFAQQPPIWTAKQLHPLIEEEIEQGRLWGTKGKQYAPPGNYRSQTSPTPSMPGKGRKLGKEEKDMRSKLFSSD